MVCVCACVCTVKSISREKESLRSPTKKKYAQIHELGFDAICGTCGFVEEEDDDDAWKIHNPRIHTRTHTNTHKHANVHTYTREG